MTAVVKTEKRASIKWVPKKWKAVYEQMILLSFMGRTNRDIARLFNYSEMQVSNILTSPQAVVLKATLTEKVIGDAQENVGETLRTTAVTASKQLKKALTDEKLWAANPLGAIDRTLKVLAAVGEIDSGTGNGVNINVNNNGRNNTTLVVPNEVAERLRKAIQISEAQHDQVEGEVLGKYLPDGKSVK